MAEHLNIIIGAKDKFSGTFKKLTNVLPSVKQLAIGAGVAVAGLGTSLYAMAKTTATSYDRIRKFSDQLGVSTEFLSKFGVAAELSGIRQETFNKSIQRLQVGIGEAARGIGQGKDAFEALGVSLRTTSGELKTSEQILPELADAFHNMSNATERAEAASKLFGQRGLEMLQLFKDGREGLDKMTAEAEKFGLVVSEKAANNAAEFNDSLTRMLGSFKGVKNAIAEDLIPIISGLQNKLADFIAENRYEITEWAKDFLISMGEVVKFVAYGVAAMIDTWTGLKEIWQILQIAFASFAEKINEVVLFIIDKFQGLIQAVNFRGIFDNDIAALQSVKDNVSEALDEIANMKQTAISTLNELAADPTAISRIDEITAKVTEAIQKIKEAGTSAANKVAGQETAIPTPEEEEIDYTSFYFPSEDQLGAELQRAAEHSDALKGYHETYLSEEYERNLAQLDSLNEMWDEYRMSDLEKLDDWYSEQQSKYSGNTQALAKLRDIYLAKKKKAELKDQKDSIKSSNKYFDDLITITQAFGERGKSIYKAFAISKGIMATYAGANLAFEQYGWPYGAIAAAAVIAQGLANVAQIASAHGGITNVPREQTYLLDAGERVLSPNQNRDLIEFMDTSKGITINNLNIYTQENLDGVDWDKLVEEEIRPAFIKLQESGLMLNES